MKKPGILLLTAAMLVSLFAGCSGNKRNDSVSSEPSAATEPAPLPTDPPASEPEASEPEASGEGVSLDEIVDAIKAAYGDEYAPDGMLPPEMLEAEFGLTPELYQEVRAEMAMVSARNDRLVIAKAATGKADQLEQALTDARQRKVEDTLQYPANIPKTNASQVVRNGDYVAFLLLGGFPEDTNATEAQQREHAEAEIQKGVDAFFGAFEG